MPCPTCGHPNTRTLHTRTDPESGSVGRTRLCKNPACGTIFTTHENVVSVIHQGANAQELRHLVGRICTLPPEQRDAVKQMVAGL